MTTKKRILILMSDTGGGHRAAAEAIRAALLSRYPDAAQVEIVDVFVEYGMYPLNKMPDMYPLMINHGKLSWKVGYLLSDHRPPTAIMNAWVTNRMGKGLERMYEQHPADVIVNVHPLMATPALRALRHSYAPHAVRPKFITVVTDLVTTHTIWYQPRADRTLVPSQPALEIGLRRGISPDRMRVTGLPVHPRFAAGLIGKAEARAKLGWNPDMPAILMIGGGSGMGPLFQIARQIDAIGSTCQIVVVAGRNAALKERLDAHQWHNTAHIYGFVTNMPELMAAADLLVTKAGPATISEACMAGLPVILSDAIPGQEDGNVTYITENGAGLYANTPAKVRDAVADWLDRGADFLHERSLAARRLATPDAVWVIANEIMAD